MVIPGVALLVDSVRHKVKILGEEMWDSIEWFCYLLRLVVFKENTLLSMLSCIKELSLLGKVRYEFLKVVNCVNWSYER